MKNQVIIAAITVTFIWISSCNCNSEKNSKNIASNDSLSYIKLEDADTFYSDWSKKNILVCQNLSEPDGLHPTNGVSADRANVFSLIHGFLIAYDIEKSDIRPDLVKSFPEISPDNLEYTYELRDEPTWDDGSLLTVDDVIFTFKANKCQLTENPSFRLFLENLSDIRKVPGNKRKFTVVMKSSYIQNIALFTDFPIIQKKYYDPENILNNYTFAQLDAKEFLSSKNEAIVQWADKFNKTENGRDPEKISGLGPYKVSAWESGQRLTLIKKEKHWTGKMNDSSVYWSAFPEKIIFIINNDANSQMLEFKAQTYDVSGSLSAKTLLELQKDINFNRNYHSAFVPTFNYTYMALNMKPDVLKRVPFFADRKVRRAMALLTPFEDIIQMIDQGKSIRVNGPVSPLKKDFNKDLGFLQYDLTKAKALLDSAGWNDTDGDNVLDKMIGGKKVSFEFELMYMNTVPDWKDIALLIQESLYKAGIKAILKPLDYTVVIQNLQQHDFDAALSVWGGSSLPEDFTQLWHTASWISNGSNYTGFGDAVSDALIDSIKTEVKDSERAVLVKKFQKLVFDEQPYVFIKSGVRKVAIHKRFGNACLFYEKPGLLLKNLKLLYNTASVVNETTSAP